MGHELIFIMRERGGAWEVLLMFDHGKKMIQFYTNPKFWNGNEVVGNWSAH
jgi:hypothetical protein